MSASTWALLLGGSLAAACAVYVARPFLREPALAPRTTGSTARRTGP